MKVSTEISVGLKRLANSALVPDQNFDLILSNLKEFLRNNKHGVDIGTKCAKVEVLKESYAALFCLLVECVRRNQEAEDVSSLLQAIRFPPYKLDKVLALYLTHRHLIHRNLVTYGIKTHHLINVSWKMNYCVKSSFSSLEGLSVYYITLDIIERGKCSEEQSEERKVTFLCTVEHLQELVSSLRAAVRKLDTIAALSSGQPN